MQTNQGSSTPQQLELQRPTAAMSIVTSLFFFWGFITSVNDILIPHLQGVFKLDNFRAMFVNFAFFSAYFIFALPWGKVVDRIGYRNTMLAGLVTAAIGCVLFVPAANYALFPLFLGALVILAGGITGLQVAANPYVAALGPARTASSRLNLAQALNSLGTIIGPPLGGMLIFSAVKAGASHLAPAGSAALRAQQLQEAASVKPLYIAFALVFLALAALIRFLHLPAMRNDTMNIRPGELAAEGQSVWKRPQVLLAALGIFVYVGAEVAIGSFLVRYFNLPEIAGIDNRTASYYVTFYWGGAMVGRFIGSALLRKVRTGTLLTLFALIASCLLVTSILTHGHVAVWTILAVGLFNSIMFPSIFTIGIEGLGSLTSEASSLIVMAIVGGAIIPLVQGKLADHIGIQHALLIPLVCYLYIALFGLWGNRRAGSEA